MYFIPHIFPTSLLKVKEPKQTNEESVKTYRPVGPLLSKSNM
jgi:hypothetical protein